MKELIQEEYCKKLKEHLNNSKLLSDGKSDIEFEEIDWVQASTQNEVDVKKLLTNEGENISFNGTIKYSIKIEEQIFSKPRRFRNLIVNTKFNSLKNSINFNLENKTTFNFID